MGIVLSWDDLKEKLDSKHNGQKIVFTNGCFDLLHIGHVTYLKEAKSLGDILVVGLNSDSSVKKLKGKERPVQNEMDRASILSELRSVDYVTIFEQDTPEKLISKISPNILVKGGDWPVEKIAGADHVLSSGGEVKTLSFVDGKSTSSILNKIKQL